MNNKIFLLAFAMIFLIGFTSAIDITNCTDLQAMENDLTADYVLTNNIDCSDTINWNGGDGFVPISLFSGNLAGNNYIISNLYINLPSTDDVGLFKYLDGNISDVGLFNVSVLGSANTGGLLGSFIGGTINNSYSTGNVSGNYNVGGLVGVNELGEISNSHSICSVYSITGDGTYGTGGLVGVNEGIITNSYFNGNVNSDVGVIGGLVGHNYPTAIIYNSYSKGNVVGSENAGGLVGQNELGIIESSYSTSNVISSWFVGGLVGYLTGGTINNSYSIGEIVCSNVCGGLVGQYDGDTTNSYSTSLIVNSTDDRIGGLVGLYQNGICNYSFWDVEKSGQATSGCGTGKTTAQMQTQSIFIDANWDFVNIWQMNPTSLYPDLINNPLIIEKTSTEETPQNNNLIKGSGTIYETMQSSGAGLGKIFEYLKVALPLLMIGLAIVGIVIIIALSIGNALKGNLLSGRR